MITLTLTGPGSGVAYFRRRSSKDPADIAINASNGKSSLTISGTNPTIGGIGVNGPIGSISASTARLTGDLIVVGDVSSISLGSPSAGTHNLTLNGPASAAVSLTPHLRQRFHHPPPDNPSAISSQPPSPPA